LIAVVLASAIERLSGIRLHREEITRVNVISPYIHALNGRLRIKVAEVKGLPMKALEVEGELRKIDGITHVRANPTTGNVLVFYDPAIIGQYEILSALQHLGYLRYNTVVRTPDRGHPRAFEGIGEAMAETLVRTTMELAVQRLVSALI
jgi:copper chaperone CopZ